MANFLLKHLRTLAITSVTLTSSFFLFHHDYKQTKHRLLSLLSVKAADICKRKIILIRNKTCIVFQERRNAKTASARNRLIDRKKEDFDEDDDDKENDKDNLEKSDAEVTNMRERRFREFASVEYNDEIYMVT